MGHRAFAETGILGAAAAAVAAIAHKPAGNRLGFYSPVYNRQIAAMRRMLTKLLRQDAFGGMRASKNHKSAGLAIDSMHCSHRQRHAAPIPAAFDLRDQMRHQLIECGLNLLTAPGPVAVSKF